MIEKNFYQGNQELKKKGVEIEFSPEQVNEIVKCYKDINYFLSNYVYIISLDKGKILFETYPFQKEMLKIFSNNRFTVCNLGRQLREMCFKRYKYTCPKQKNWRRV